MLSEKDNKTRIPYEHYREEFAAADPAEMAARTGIAYDKDKQTFRVRIMGRGCDVKWPELTAADTQGNEYCEYNALILTARFLTAGHAVPTRGKMISYTDMPAGDLYYQAFKGRCLSRLAYTFGTKPEAFKKAMEALGAEKYDAGDAAYRFEVFNGFYMCMAIWLPDEDFGPSAQILFSDNFPEVFSTEDASVCGDIAISAAKKAVC